jgi:hypothetical protein
VKPVRSIFGQKTMITRSIHSLAYDPVKDEIVVPHFHAQAVQFFRGDANGDVAPVRMIFGPDVKVPNWDNLAIDSIHREIFVGLGGSERAIAVYPLDASGNVGPIRILQGPDTRIKYANSSFRPAVDPVHNLMFVGGEGGILVFDRTASGNTKPLRILSAPKNLTRRALGTPVVDPESGLLFVEFNTEPPSELGSRTVIVNGKEMEVTENYDQHSENSYIGVWHINDGGEVAPRWTIGGGPNGIMRDPVELLVDAKNKTLFIFDRYTNSVLEYSIPEVFQ